MGVSYVKGIVSKYKYIPTQPYKCNYFLITKVLYDDFDIFKIETADTGNKNPRTDIIGTGIHCLS